MYRVTWALVALPLLIAAFTVGRPEPLPNPDLPPSFDGASAAQVAETFAERFPNRAPGTEQGAEATAWVRDRLEEYHLEVDEQRFTAELPGRGRVELVNLIARPLSVGPQRSGETIVVMAARDNLDMAPGLDRNASGTAALIELARELSTLTVAHTIAFVSTDGGAWGNLGAAYLSDDETFRDTVLAVVNLDSVAGPGIPRLEIAGENARSPAGALVATAHASLLEENESGREPGHENAFNQLLDLAFPINFYDQAPLLGGGVSSITLTAAGSRPPRPGDDAAAFTPDRIGEIGRAAQSLVLSVDAAAEVASGTESYVYLNGRVLRGFSIQLLLVVALLPALVATIDLWARLRRRELVLGAALRSYRSRLGVWLWAGGLGALFTLLGLFPNGEPRPLPLDIEEAQRWPFAAVAGLVALSGVGWLLARARLVPREPVERGDELAGHLAAMLVLCVIAIAMAVVNLYLLLFVLPSLHAWLWAPHVRDSAPWLRALAFCVGLAGPAALLVATAFRFDLGLDAPWYVATLFTTGYASVVQLVLLLAWGAVAGQVGAFVFGRYAPYPTEGDRPVRGVVREAVRLTVVGLRRLGGGRRGSDREEDVRAAPEPLHPVEQDALPRP
jgi:hypothetical protein